MKKINKKTYPIELVLENCEVIFITNKDIEWLLLDGITQRIQCLDYHDKPLKSQSCNYFEIIIKKEANKKYKPFNLKSEKSVNKFDRLLAYRDITQVWRNNEQVLVPWDDGDCWYDNKLHTSWIDAEGNLHIKIKERSSNFN